MMDQVRRPPVGSRGAVLQAPQGSLDGMRLFARFAFMPNRLGYCGGDVNAELLEYLKGDVADAGLRRHLTTFAAAYPYLQLIAESNGIPDPFDQRVVEAYWIGNDLLEGVEWDHYARHLHERFHRRLRSSTLELLVGKPPAGARAHHAFQVFDVSFRTGLPHGDAANDAAALEHGLVEMRAIPDFQRQQRQQRFALVGEPVFESLAVLADVHLRQDVPVHQVFQAA